MLVLLMLVLLAGALTAGAAPRTTSDLLLPYFEVSLDGPGVTTLLAVVNTSSEEVPVQVAVQSNWGIEVLRVPLVLPPDGVQSINLRDWLVDGRLPQGQTMSAADLAHVVAALCGEASPRDGLYYATAMADRRAVGSVTVRTLDRGAQVLTGDYFVVDPGQDLAQGEMLVDIDLADACGSGLCRRHALRFLDGGAFDSGTEIIVWTPRQATPVAQPFAAADGPVELAARAFEEPGAHSRRPPARSAAGAGGADRRPRLRPTLRLARPDHRRAVVDRRALHRRRPLQRRPRLRLHGAADRRTGPRRREVHQRLRRRRRPRDPPRAGQRGGVAVRGHQHRLGAAGRRDGDATTTPAWC